MTSENETRSSLSQPSLPGSPFADRSVDLGPHKLASPGATCRRASFAQNLTLLLCGLLALPSAVLAKDKDKDKDKGKVDKGLKNAVVLIIRHGEKPNKGQDLSKAGKERAQAYVKYFENYTVGPQPFKPDYLFAAADSKDSQRPRLTLEPFSKAAGLKIDARFECTKNQGLVDAIKKKPAGKQYLICWHHTEIPHLLSALGADAGTLLPDGKWPDAVFGWVIQLRYDSDGHVLDAKRISENLMPDDSGN